MGVTGLHQFVSSIATEDFPLSSLANKTVAVDASAWLFKGLFACPIEIAQGQVTDRFLDTPLRLVELLRSFDISPYFVFDGAVLPMKAERSASDGGRQHQRAAALARAVEALREEGPTDRTAQLCSKAICVLPWMVTRLIEELRKRDVAYVVAPYEADPQLAYLVRERICSCALSEDSDLLPYGCPAVLYKLSEQTARGTLISLDDLRSAEDSKGHLFDGLGANEWEEWRNGRFIDLCALAGTDYLPALKGIGIKTAHVALRKHSTVERAVRVAPLASKVQKCVADIAAYLADVDKVRSIFRHALVYDPRHHHIVPLNPAADGQAIPAHVGRVLDQPVARRVCWDATLDPTTLEARRRDPAPTSQTRTVVAAMQDFDARRKAAAAYQAISQLPNSQESTPCGDVSCAGKQDGVSVEPAAADIAALAEQANGLGELGGLGEPGAQGGGGPASAASASGRPVGARAVEPPAHGTTQDDADDDDGSDAQSLASSQSRMRGHIVELYAHLRQAPIVRAMLADPERAPALSHTGALWLLHSHLAEVFLARPDEHLAPGRSSRHPTSAQTSNAECQRALKPTLVFLARLAAASPASSPGGGLEGSREDGREGAGAGCVASWPTEDRALYRDALACCWRQALLETLRHSAREFLDWERFAERVRALPADAADELRAELEQLCRPSPRGAVCDCTPPAVKSLRAHYCETPYTCQQVRRRVQAYVVLHPPNELHTPLRKLLEAASRLLPSPALSASFVQT